MQSRGRLPFPRRLCAGRASFIGPRSRLGKRRQTKPPEDYEIVASNYADLLRSLGKARTGERSSKSGRGKRRRRVDSWFDGGCALARHGGCGQLSSRFSQAHVAEWQTRTAQDRMGKPVEVRLLS